MALLNYTTQIDVDKTIGEIQKLLVKRGAKTLMTEYNEGVIAVISFKISVGERDMGFRLPCDWRPVLEVMQNDPNIPRKLKTQFQAVRVAWRIIKDWVEAQMALVDTMMVKTEEVFLPYAIMRDGRTLAEHATSGQLMIGDGN